jgi:hypothetical protein
MTEERTQFYLPAAGDEAPAYGHDAKTGKPIISYDKTRNG